MGAEESLPPQPAIIEAVKVLTNALMSAPRKTLRTDPRDVAMLHLVLLLGAAIVASLPRQQVNEGKQGGLRVCPCPKRHPGGTHPRDACDISEGFQT
jgi:hypothetical protein